MSRARLLAAGALAGVAAALLVPAPAIAQATIASEEDCARLPSQEEELACLRAALSASRDALAEANGEPPAATPASPPPARPAADPAREVAASPAPAAAAPAMGAEQVRAPQLAEAPEQEQEREREALAATVTDFRTDGRGLLVMQLSNGQIWRQDEHVGGPVPLGDHPTAGVEITRSGFGGYRMSFPSLGRRIAVSRLR